MSEILEITLDDLIKDTEPNIDKNNNLFSCLQFFI